MLINTKYNKICTLFGNVVNIYLVFCCDVASAAEIADPIIVDRMRTFFIAQSILDSLSAIPMIGMGKDPYRPVPCAYCHAY